jgi:ribosomal protein L4
MEKILEEYWTSDPVFAIEPNNTLYTLMLSNDEANQRQGTHKAKERLEEGKHNV